MFVDARAADAFSENTQTSFTAAHSTQSRSFATRLGELRSILDYATCDGSAADLARINAFMSLMNGGGVLIPTKCKISGTINLPSVTIYAAPFSGDGFVTTSPTADVLSTKANNVALIGLTIATAVRRTAGAYFKASPAIGNGFGGRYEISQVDLEDPFTGLDFEAYASVVHVSHSKANFYGQRPASGCSLITYNVITGQDDFNVDWLDAFGTPAARCENGILLTGGSDVAINNSNLDQFNRALYARIPAGRSLVSLRSSNTYYDSAGIVGVDLFADGGTIARADFVQSWTSSAVASDGFYAHTAKGGLINGLDLVQHQAFGNGANGVDFADAGVSNAHVIAGEFAGNASCGVNDGPNTGFALIGAISGATGGFPQNKYGVCVWKGAADFRVIGNDLRNNTIAAATIAPPTSATAIVSGNVGYDVGNITYSPDVAQTWSEDVSGSAVTLAANGGPGSTLRFPEGAGEITLSESGTGSVAKYLVGGGAVTLLGQGGTVFVAGSPAPGKISLQFTGKAYVLTNGTKSSIDLGVHDTRLRSTN